MALEGLPVVPWGSDRGLGCWGFHADSIEARLKSILVNTFMWIDLFLIIGPAYKAFLRMNEKY